MISDELRKSIEVAGSKEEISKLLGYKYCNGVIRKKIDKFVIEHNIQLENLGTRINKRKYKRIMRNCPICDNEFETKLGHKREKYTCGKTSCSNFYFRDRYKNNTDTVERLCSKCGTTIIVGKNAGKDTIAYCSSCRKSMKYIYKENIPKYNIICEYCNKKFETTHSKSRFCSSSCGQKELVRTGKHKGWKSRKKLVPSYPEKYFMEVLKNGNIEYEYEKKCGKYFIDFALDKYMIALEIDGKQHNLLERIESDVKKDIVLKQNGYNVVRIKWFNPITEKNKEKLYNQIIEFKKLIK